MGKQKELFGFHDMRPRTSAGLKQIITKERIKEVQALLEKNDGHGAANALRDLRYKLEAYERRIVNK